MPSRLSQIFFHRNLQNLSFFIPGHNCRREIICPVGFFRGNFSAVRQLQALSAAKHRYGINRALRVGAVPVIVKAKIQPSGRRSRIQLGRQLFQVPIRSFDKFRRGLDLPGSRSQFTAFGAGQVRLHK